MFILVIHNQFTSSLTNYEMVQGLMVFSLFMYALFWSLLCLGEYPSHLGWDVPKKTPCIPLFTQTKTLGCLCCHVAHTPRPSHLPLASSFLDLLEFSDGHGEEEVIQ